MLTLSTQIEFKNRKLTYYKGDYDTYVKTSDEMVKNSMRVYQAYQDKRAHMMEFVSKVLVSHSNTARVVKLVSHSYAARIDTRSTNFELARTVLSWCKVA